jgi:DNA-binding NarL/FixJ family response regulator
VSSHRISVALALEVSPLELRVRSALASESRIEVRTSTMVRPRTASEHPGIAALICAAPWTESLRALQRAGPDVPGRTRLIAIVPDVNLGELREMVNRGVDGIVLEPSLEQSLAATILAVCSGQVVVPRPFAGALTRPNLTIREKQVLAMVVMGLSNRDIAEQLVLAESTVKSHLFSAFRRLGVRTRKEAITLILDPEQGFGSGILSISDR